MGLVVVWFVGFFSRGILVLWNGKWFVLNGLSCGYVACDNEWSTTDRFHFFYLNVFLHCNIYMFYDVCVFVVISSYSYPHIIYMNVLEFMRANLCVFYVCMCGLSVSEMTLGSNVYMFMCWYYSLIHY